MPSTIINLTLIKLNEELDKVLANSQNSIYRTTLTDLELRHSLIVYVLNRMPNRHVTIELDQMSCLSSQKFIGLTEETLTMENLVHQGIYYLNQKSPDDTLNLGYRSNDSNYPHPTRFR